MHYTEKNMPASVELVALDFRGIPGLIRGKTELFLFLSTGSSAAGVIIGRAFDTDEWPPVLECLAMGGTGTYPPIPSDLPGVFLYFKVGSPLNVHARVLALSVCQDTILPIAAAWVHHADSYHPVPLWDGSMEIGEPIKHPQYPRVGRGTKNG
jgi:hypothetical protein